jgi:hypothetical protein
MLDMEEVLRLIDADAASLEMRVTRSLERDGDDCFVMRFTYWYTGRPPMHEAVVVRARDTARAA